MFEAGQEAVLEPEEFSALCKAYGDALAVVTDESAVEAADTGEPEAAPDKPKHRRRHSAADEVGDGAGA